MDQSEVEQNMNAKVDVLVRKGGFEALMLFYWHFVYILGVCHNVVDNVSASWYDEFHESQSCSSGAGPNRRRQISLLSRGNQEGSARHRGKYDGLLSSVL